MIDNPETSKLTNKGSKMKLYRASVIYNEESLKRMGKMQAHSRYFYNAVYTTVCLALILIGVYLSATTAPGLTCIAIGGIGLPIRGSVIKYRTENVIKALAGKTIHVNYKFEKDEIFLTTKDQSNRFKYSALTKLWEDVDYYYLFCGRKEVLMVSKKSLVPKNPENFKSDLSKVTGLSWFIYTSVPIANLRAFLSDLRRNLRSRFRM